MKQKDEAKVRSYSVPYMIVTFGHNWGLNDSILGLIERETPTKIVDNGIEIRAEN
jgi:hypothetical protein